MDASFSGAGMSRPYRCRRRHLTAAGPATARSGGREFYVVSVQRNPDSEEPEAPSAEYRIEHRDRVVAVVIERPEITLRVAPVTRRTIPWAVPTTGRRRTAPATRGRRPVPERRRCSGRRPTIPAESMLSRWRRRTVVGCAEAVRRIPGAAHLRATPLVRTPGCVRRRSTGSARSAGSTRSRTTRPARSAGPRPVGEGPMPSGSWLQRRGIGGLDAHRQCRNADACGNRRTCHALHIHTC
jgi:hypothetical protein